eukprot:6214822-Pleurochrysis_carterae.AAC.1
MAWAGIGCMREPPMLFRDGGAVLLRRRCAALRERPFTLALGVATLKTCAADAITQYYIEGKEALDWHRLTFFTAFGLTYLGAFQYALYVKAFGRSEPVADRWP